MPVAFDRAGERPKLVRSRSAGEMRQAIAEAVRVLRGKEDVRSVAILTKWGQTAEGIYRTLNEQGMEDVGLLTSGGLVATDINGEPDNTHQGAGVRRRHRCQCQQGQLHRI